MATPTIPPLSTYTEGDVPNWISLTGNRVDVTTMDRDVDSYLRYDLGAGAVNAISFPFIVYASAISGAGAQSAMGFTVDAETNGSGMGTTDVRVDHVYNGVNTIIRLNRGPATADDSYIIGRGVQTGTIYYCLLSRTASSDTINLYIYSDAARTSLLDTLTVAGYGVGTTYRYHMAMVGYNDGTGGLAWSGYWDLSECVSAAFLPKIIMF